MSFSTFGGLKAAIAAFLDRDDLTAQIADFVTLATATLNKVLRDRRMVTAADIALSVNPRWVTLPADMLQPIWAVWLVEGSPPLELVSPERIGELRRTRFRLAGTPRFYAVVGNRLELCPTPADVLPNLEFAYYAEIPALVSDGDTNWVLTDDPDVYLYTALLHAAVYLHDPGLAATVKPLLDQRIAASVVVEEQPA